MSEVIPFFPPFTPEVKRFLTLVPKLMASVPVYLNHAECPYEDIDLIERAFPQAAPVDPNAPLLPKDSQFYTDQEINMEEEAKAMYWEIQHFKKNLDIEDVSERVQLFRLSTTLLEKLLAIKEAAAGIKKFEEFQQLILDTLDRYLDPVQKSEFSRLMAATFGDED